MKLPMLQRRARPVRPAVEAVAKVPGWSQAQGRLCGTMARQRNILACFDKTAPGGLLEQLATCAWVSPSHDNLPPRRGDLVYSTTDPRHIGSLTAVFPTGCTVEWECGIEHGIPLSLLRVAEHQPGKRKK